MSRSYDNDKTKPRRTPPKDPRVCLATGTFFSHTETDPVSQHTLFFHSVAGCFDSHSPSHFRLLLFGTQLLFGTWVSQIRFLKSAFTLTSINHTFNFRSSGPGFPDPVSEALLSQILVLRSDTFITSGPLSIHRSASHNSPLVHHKTSCREDVMAIAFVARE